MLSNFNNKIIGGKKFAKKLLLQNNRGPTSYAICSISRLNTCWMMMNDGAVTDEAFDLREIKG